MIQNPCDCCVELVWVDCCYRLLVCRRDALVGWCGMQVVQWDGVNTRYGLDIKIVRPGSTHQCSSQSFGTCCTKTLDCQHHANSFQIRDSTTNNNREMFSLIEWQNLITINDRMFKRTASDNDKNTRRTSLHRRSQVEDKRYDSPLNLQQTLISIDKRETTINKCFRSQGNDLKTCKWRESDLNDESIQMMSDLVNEQSDLNDEWMNNHN